MAKNKEIICVPRITFHYCRNRKEYIRDNAIKRHLKVCDGKHVYTRMLKSKVAYYVK